MGPALFGTSNQGWVFLFMVYGGVVLGLLYDLVTVARRMLHIGGLWVALVDLVYWLAATAVAFGFLYLAGQGEFRLYHVLGFALGAALYALGPGRLLDAALRRLIRLWRGLLARFRQTMLYRFLSK